MVEQAGFTPLKVYTTTWCSDCHRSRRWLNANYVPYYEINIEEHADAADYVMSINHGSRTVPTIVFPDGSILTEPSNAKLALRVYQVLGILTADAERALAQR